MRDKHLEGIADLRDESDRDGMRIVIELKRGELPEVVLNNLYKHTKLQMSYGITLLAIVAGRPRVLNLLEIVEHFIEFRREVVRRRTEFELRKAEARAHILEGLKIALDHLDAVISLIRRSANPAEARIGLVSEFGLTVIQAQAILDMQLQRLTGLERQKILDELAELAKTIERLRAILSNDELLMAIVIEELEAVREKYGDARRTEIIEESGEFRVEDLIADEDVVITATSTGYIKRTALDAYRKQRRGGKGLIGMQTREEDVVQHLFVANTHAYILIFTDRGRVLLAARVRRARGQPQQQGQVDRQPRATWPKARSSRRCCACRNFPPRKASASSSWARGRARSRRPTSPRSPIRARPGIIAIQIDDDDRLIAVAETDGTKDLVHRVTQRHGDSIRRSRRAAHGPHGLRRARHAVARGRRSRRDGGRRATRARCSPSARTATASAPTCQRVPRQSRGGIGLKNVQTSERNGLVVGIACVTDRDELLLVTEQGQIIRMKAGDLRPIGRDTQGVTLMDLAEGDRSCRLRRCVSRTRGSSEADRSDSAARQPSRPQFQSRRLQSAYSPAASSCPPPRTSR